MTQKVSVKPTEIFGYICLNQNTARDALMKENTNGLSALNPNTLKMDYTKTSKYVLFILQLWEGERVSIKNSIFFFISTPS